MGKKFQSVIDRKPGDCDFDLTEVCESVKFQNSAGNLLRNYKIEADKITLEYETSD